MSAALRSLLERLSESIVILEEECDAFAVPIEIRAAAEAIRRHFDDLKWHMGRDSDAKP